MKRSSLLVVLETCNFITNKFFHKASSQDSENYFAKHSICLLVKSERRHMTYEKVNIEYKAKRECFQYVLSPLHFFNVFLIKIVGAVRNL